MIKMTVGDWICYLNNKINSTGALLYGYLSPSDACGKNDDIYLEFNGGNIYKKIDNIWTLQGSIYDVKVDGGKF